MRIVVDRNRCTGLGICESVAPEFFEVREDGSMEVLQERAGDESLDQLQEAVAGCPTEALSLEK